MRSTAGRTRDSRRRCDSGASTRVRSVSAVETCRHVCCELDLIRIGPQPLVPMPVDADFVAQLIETARRSMGPQRFGHDLELDRCCVRPTRATVVVDQGSRPALECWVVLEVDPDAGAGYSIVYDDQSEEFGLALRTSSAERLLVGWYGSFSDALEAM